ncbi:MAG TPA: alpha/beta hydrolase [bacterium]|nr:alpha/beta hydrolase [bacterium]
MLNHVLVADPAARPRSWLLMLHGIFGAGRNWATVARRLAAARPDWGIVLVDLRMHGASQGLAPPHTLESCAADLVGLREVLDAPVGAVLGHSFGGKVALTYLERRPPELRGMWIVDADPSASAPQGAAWDMLRAVDALPRRFGSRDELVAALGRFGFDRRVAEWMAANLDRAGGGYRWRLDFAALEELLRDFFRSDLWNVVEHAPAGVDLHFVAATRSSVIGESSAARLEAIRRTGGRVVLHRVDGGHWLNADNPDALVALLAGSRPSDP